MVQMDLTSVKERYIAIDLENGIHVMNSVKERYIAIDLENGIDVMNSEVEDGETLVENKFGGEEESSPLGRKKKARGEKPKKKSCKKPPKPPRPPRAPSMDAADQKLMREISEMAALKRARIERMKALKRMKNAKASSLNGNLVPCVVTLIFCVVILWQGFFSKGSSSLRFHGSPESSTGARGGFISVQFYNASSDHGSSLASPNNVEQVSGSDNNGGGR